tara:strand:- start:3025 stop:4245 length:1221 start_codon:yes stop_codon:yes gene_type:complete
MDKKSIRTRLKEDLRKWFDKDHPKGGWKRYNTKGEAIGPCAREEGEGTPKCLSNEKAAKMTKQERAAAVRRKRKKDPVADKKGKGNKPKMVSNKIKEDFMKTRNLEIGMSLQLKESIHFVEKITRISETFYKIETIDSNGNRDKEYLHRNEDIKLHEETECLEEEKGKGKKLNKPFRTPGGPKKFSVYVKNEKGNVVKVNFGDPNMEIKRDDPKRRKSFRARHNCDNPGPKTKARYWSCYQWRGGQKVEDDFKPTGDMLQEKEEMKEIPKKVKKIAKELDAAVKMHTSQAKRLRDAGISEDENACGCDEITEGKKNKPTKPALWSRAKALAKKKFDVYPSAYANGWAAKWYKKRGGGWKTVNESVNSDVETKIKRQLENLGGLSGNDHANKKTRTRLAQIIKAAAK